MLEYGVKIKNIEASTLFEYNNGVRDHYEYKDAMFNKSLFYHYLINENDLENSMMKVRNERTNDIVCFEFNYGSRSYIDEKEHLSKLIEKCETEIENTTDSYILGKLESKLVKLKKLDKLADENRGNYIKLNREQMRNYFYENGIDIVYNYNKRKSEKIHYVMLYRSTGKAKKGTCMFINEKLYEKARNFLYMGIKLPKENAPIVEIGAYASLISSGIENTITIKPEEILVVKDVDSYCKKTVTLVDVDSEKQCYAKTVENYDLFNTMFDGQALIDDSIFPEWGDGYLLLRQHMTKCAAFRTYIQKFFKDYYGANYEKAVITDYFGREVKVKDVKMITTENALKWIKFNVSYDYWSDWVRKNECKWGVVKTAHKSKLGEVQQMSYQMVNALATDIMKDVSNKTVEYINDLKLDDEVFLDYLRKNDNFAMDYNVLLALVEHNEDFLNCDYFRNRKSVIIRNYKKKCISGKLLQNADNLVLVGSPYAMLLHSVGESVDNDVTFNVENDCIQCYTERFDDGEYLAEFRSPFNSRANLGVLHNVNHEYFHKYFNFGKQIIAVNTNHTDFEDRNNGSDFDSDSIYTTNQEKIVEHAKFCYNNYHTVVNNIPQEKTKYNSDILSFAKVDNMLAKSQMAIGRSANVAQLCLTYSYNNVDDKFVQYADILAVLSQVSIDNTKRKFDVDVDKEIKRIENEIEVKENGYPLFWLSIRKGFDKSKINYELNCPMNYLYGLETVDSDRKQNVQPISDFFIKHKSPENKRKSKSVEQLINKYSLEYNQIRSNGCEISYEDYNLFKSNFEDLIKDIRKIYISGNYVSLFSWLINRAFEITPTVQNKLHHTEISKNRSLLLKTLYEVNPKAFLKCFEKK